MTRTAEVAPAWRERLAAAGLRDVGALLNGDSPAGAAGGDWAALTKPGLGGRERWRWEFHDQQGPSVVFVKRYARTPWRAQLDRIRRQTAGHSVAWWEYQQSLRLDAARIPVPRAVAYVEEMRGTLEQRSAVLLEQVPGDAFDRAWTRLALAKAPAAAPRLRQELTRRLGRFISAFHQTGLCHRDLYLCHVFVELDAAGRRPPAFSLIDLARTHAPRWRRMRWLLKDLSQLDSSGRQIGATRSDRLRFLLAYLSLQRGAARARWYAARILRRSDQILARLTRKLA
jgi:heptose I phosphotransferase